MGDKDPATANSRKELRKKKMMEYLTNKDKHISKTHVSELPRKKPETTRSSALQIIRDKENKAPVTSFRQETKKVQPLALLNNKNPPRTLFSAAKKQNVLTEHQPTHTKKSTLTRIYTVSTLKETNLSKKPPIVRTQPAGKAVSVTKSSKGAFKPPPTVKTYTARLSLGPVVKTRTGLIPAMIQPRVNRPLPTTGARVAPSRAAVPSSKAVVKKIPLPQIPTALQEPRPVPVKRPPCKTRPESTVTAKSLPDKAANRPLKRTTQPKVRPTVQNSQVVASRSQTAAKPKMADTVTKKTSAPLEKRTASRSVVAVGSHATLQTKATKPQTAGKKMTAEQEERMKKLQEWREAKGISYKRPSTLVKPQVRRTAAEPLVPRATLKAQDDACSFVRDVDSCLADCIKLLAEGGQAPQVRTILSRLPPVSQKFAKFWVCQLRLMEQEGNLDVLPVFEEAVRVTVEPVDELRAVVFNILKKKETQASEEDVTEISKPSGTAGQTDCEDENPTTTPPVRVLITGERGTSSTVKYKITATPGAPSTQQSEPIVVDGHEVRFFTPVRRSVRIESVTRPYPAALREHDLCVASFAELLANEEDEEEEGRDTLYVYRENEALQDKVALQVMTELDERS
ncbi:cytoskeleton-associated protein 2-like [Corythoichthys intestinalis]|uniref:cytoskeleton-associated protein 2-like n=1 Tax=Corythoichthys intestinalis TaxID=161448 RepID=UPI0025A64BC6|nr:cytoskeleton-associated protein 2-like [Corythoichthys intestinalis]XP_061804480.1 cytoskeleton-associated protein 2-like [Nerophis lumbriciformis]